MTKEEREDIIDGKCDQAGCTEKERARHRQFFVYERWDVHPPADFKPWLDDAGEGGNPVTAWNCDRSRQEFFKARGQGA